MTRSVIENCNHLTRVSHNNNIIIIVRLAIVYQYMYHCFIEFFTQLINKHNNISMTVLVPEHYNNASITSRALELLNFRIKFIKVWFNFRTTFGDDSSSSVVYDRGIETPIYHNIKYRTCFMNHRTYTVWLL